MNSRKGFTLIELLVVIAIIAILAAILFPVFAQAREKARQASCLSNTKQLALGVQMYSQDYDETLPVAGYGSQCRGRWHGQIYPYVKNAQVFTCPNIAAQKWTATLSASCGQQVYNDDRGGYGWNYALAGANGNGGAAPGYALAQIAKPADTIIIGDTGFVGTTAFDSGWAMLAADPRKANSTAFSQPGLYPQFRHNTTQTKAVAGGKALPTDGRANFAFLDGHSKNLNVGTAFQAATTEDGATLVSEGTTPNHVNPAIEYILWNVY